MKKIKLLLVNTFILFSIILFSCASTPTESESNIAEESVQSAVNEQETTNEDLKDLEEPVQDEVLPELTENEIQNNSEIESDNESLSQKDEISYEPVNNEDATVEFLLKEAENQEEERKRLEKEIERLTSELEQFVKNEDTKQDPQVSSDQAASELNEANNNQPSDSLSIKEEETSSTESLDGNNSSGQIDQNLAETEETEEDYSIDLDKIIPSRTVTMQRNQFIDITYPGKGWIYQGNIDSEGNIDIKNKNFIFGGRKLGGKDQSFTLRSRVPGEFLLHFYKNDTLTGNYIDDYLKVIVQDKNTTPDTHITAPSYAEIVPPKAKITAESVKAQKKEQEKQKEVQETQVPGPLQKIATQKNSQQEQSSREEKDSSAKTVIQTTDQNPEKAAASNTNEKKLDNNKNSANNEQPKETTLVSEANLTSDELLNKAQMQYNQKQYAEALKSITDFFDKSATRIDEGLFLQGQILEEKSPVQNIKDAIESYDLVVKNYPASKLWDKANKRSIFLKRFYINIR